MTKTWDWEKLQRLNPDLHRRVESHRDSEGVCRISQSLATEVDAWFAQIAAEEAGQRNHEAHVQQYKDACRMVDEVHRKRAEADAAVQAALAKLRELFMKHRVIDNSANGKLIEDQMGDTPWTPQSLEAAFEAVRPQLERHWEPRMPLPDNPTPDQLNRAPLADVKAWKAKHTKTWRPSSSFSSRL